MIKVRPGTEVPECRANPPREIATHDPHVPGETNHEWIISRLRARPKEGEGLKKTYGERQALGVGRRHDFSRCKGSAVFEIANRVMARYTFMGSTLQ